MADKYKTLPIGTIFTYNGNKYKVCNSNACNYSCTSCAFDGVNCDNIKSIRGNCISSKRTDSRQVYYEQINNETMKKDSGNIVCPTFNTNDSLNDLHVECPKGYLIDAEHSDLSKGIIKFKKYNITLKDIYEDNNTEYAKDLVIIKESKIGNKLEAIAKLIDIANYYNKDWKPDLDSNKEYKYSIQYNKIYNEYSVYCSFFFKKESIIYFKNKEDAQTVIDNPNFRAILDTIFKV